MIALRKEKREELTAFINASIEQRCTVYTLEKQRELETLRDHIALASLTAGPVNPADCFEPVYLSPPVPEIKEPDYFSDLVKLARGRAEKAMRKFPQPNYVLNKVAEESGEVIKAVIHFTEGRETWENVESELIDNLAMLIRLVTEGDGVIGFNVPEDVRRLNGLGE